MLHHYYTHTYINKLHFPKFSPLILLAIIITKKMAQQENCQVVMTKYCTDNKRMFILQVKNEIKKINGTSQL